MKAPFSLLARCLLFTFILANSLDAANPTAADVRRALGADRGLFVVLSNDAWPLASELVKTTELTLLVQTSDLTVVARMQKQAENAGWLGSRVYVEHGGKRIHLAQHMADGVIVGAGADASDVARVARPGAALYINGKLSCPRPERYWSEVIYLTDGQPFQIGNWNPKGVRVEQTEFSAPEPTKILSASCFVFP